MEQLLRHLGLGFAVVAAGVWLWVAGFNWTVVVRTLWRRNAKPPSMILVAGPVLVVCFVQALRAAAPGWFNSMALPVLLLGLALDPGAVPLVAAAAVRKLVSETRRRAAR